MPYVSRTTIHRYTHRIPRISHSKSSLSFLLFTALLLLFIPSAQASIEPGDGLSLIDEAENYYFLSDYTKAESIVVKLVGTHADDSGAATLLLAGIYHSTGRDEQALELLQSHEALVDLYNAPVPAEHNEATRYWSDDHKLRYFQLKGLYGKLRYLRGERDDGVLNDMMDGVAFDDHDWIPIRADVEALQYIALMLYEREDFSGAVFHWKRSLVAVERIPNQRPLTLVDINYYHATEYNIGCAYANIGDIEQTLYWLRRSLAHDRDHRIDYIMSDHDLDAVRNNEAFKRFIAEFDLLRQQTEQSHLLKK